jgi:4-hydroxybenzoate polyprenyltransferase
MMVAVHSWTLVVAALAFQLGALAITSYALLDAVRDVRRLARLGIGNGRRLVIAGSVRREALRLATLTALVWLTVMLLGQIDRSRPSPDTWVLAVLGLFLVAQVTTALNSWLDVLLWRQLRRGDR